MAKPKVAFYWCSSCGGCEESIVDLAEDILKVIELADIVFWPVALDFKYSDVEALSDAEITVTLINGAIRMEEQERIARLLRRKSKIIIAHGSCAGLGGVLGLANLFESEEILKRAYKDAPSVKNPQGKFPQVSTEEFGRALELPEFYGRLKPLHQVIEVDYYIPGCPPEPELIKNALCAVLDTTLPPKGAVLAEKKSLCDSCSRRDTKSDTLKIRAFERIHEKTWDSRTCFLDQGIICLGPATRGGCKARCIKGNMPCRGCFGPTDNVIDQGIKSLSFLSSLIDANDEQALKGIADAIPDLAGLFYRYSLASSIVYRKEARAL